MAGERFGVIRACGGDVANAGDIAGVDVGLFIPGTALDSGERSGLTASVVNSATITGSRTDGLSGYGVGFGRDLASATLDNSGTIVRAAGTGRSHGPPAPGTINQTGGGSSRG